MTFFPTESTPDTVGFIMSMKVLLLIFFFATLSYACPHASSCRCRPHQSCWPSLRDWNALNDTIEGNLVALRPAAAACHPHEADEVFCKIVTEQWTNSTWRATQPGAVQYENFEAWAERNESCYIENPPNVPCGQGRISLYSALVKSAAHIQEAVRFANRRNLRVVIRNSGHDFLGRSAVPESLQIFTNHMKGISFVDDFVPTGAPGDASEGPAVTIDAGVNLREIYTAVGVRNRTFVGGSAHTVGAAGGYVQGGGHSFLGPWKGMASDHALQFTVVTADVRPVSLRGGLSSNHIVQGELVTANKHQNSDLFWALRGGGGGTFGVVVNVTLQTFDEAPAIFVNLNVTSISGNPNYWEALAKFHAAVPSLSDTNGGGYYQIFPNYPLGNLTVSVLTGELVFPNRTNPAGVQQLLDPLFAGLNNLSGIRADYSLLPFPNILTLINNTLFHSDHDPTGIVALLGSRLFSRDLISSTKGVAKLISTLQRFDYYPAREVIGHIVAGGAVAANGESVDSAVHPAWRETALHLIITQQWNATASLGEQEAIRNLTDVEVPLLRSVEGPHAMGAYLNEADPHETDFQASFWGKNYPRLYELKQKWDPTGLFIVNRGVGSEDWDEEGFCRCV
ncbi:hypothetical protein BDV59DRAFT_180015 [Aspergillus ambiguus]|uniref:FAD-dependent oxidoreductase n=1 Tax=Aspergillus ambiguus TaxID=176160 RepID=UPI003CCD1D5D